MKSETSNPPQEKKTKGEFGIAKVTMVNGNVKVEMKSTDSVYTIKKEDVPEYFPYKDKAVLMAHVTMTQDGQQMLYATPARGDYAAKFICIGKEGEPPVARTNQYGQSFGVIVEIKNNAWAGARAIKWFNLQEYKEGYSTYCVFGKDENGNVKIDGWGKPYEELTEFVTATGLENVDIPYSENPLPAIQKAILEIGKDFLIGLSLNTKSNYIDVVIQEDFVLPVDMEDFSEPHFTPDGKLQCMVNGEGKKDSVEMLTEEEIAIYRKNGYTVK